MNNDVLVGDLETIPELPCDDEGAGAAHPWDRSPVPVGVQIRGLGPITISVPDRKTTDRVLTAVLGLRAVRDYATPADPRLRDGRGPLSYISPSNRAFLPSSRAAGGVHHVAFPHPRRRLWCLGGAAAQSTAAVERAGRPLLLSKL
jgi:glyoxalase family protein